MMYFFLEAFDGGRETIKDMQRWTMEMRFFVKFYSLVERRERDALQWKRFITQSRWDD